MTVLPPPQGPSDLPPGYAPVELLASGTQGQVWRCLHQGQPRVVRLVAPGVAEALALLQELRVLAALDHPSLAKLVDHGTLPGGGQVYLARSWIEGRTLAEHLRSFPAGSEAREREVARVGAGICDALEVLHGAGFVHADLKPENVLVRPDGVPVLTDFGLSRARGGAADASGVSGSLATLAPEQLAGAALTPAADLFALGAMLFDALAVEPRSLERFYARFPGVDFFQAAGSSAERLPAWARGLVAELLLRDPAQRPASAALVARRLRAAHGAARPEREPERWLWPASTGREEWFARFVEQLPARTECVLELALPEGEDPAALLAELRRALAFAGVHAAQLELRPALESATSLQDLDHWCAELLASSPGRLLLCALPEADPLARRALEYLARALLAARGRGGPRLLLAGAPLGLPIARELVPAAGRDGLAAALGRGLEPASRSHLSALVERVWTETRAAPARVQAWLDAASRARVLDRTEQGWRLAGSLAAVDLAASGADDPQALARDVCGPGASAEELVEVAGPLGPRARREFHARRARWLEAAGAPEALCLVHRWIAAREPATLDALLGQLGELRERGLPERVLDLCARVRREHALEQDVEPPLLVAEEAQAWAALGELERARALLKAHPGASGPAEEAALERARGAICARSYEHTRALQHFARAAELDPARAGEAELGRALVLFETRDEEQLERLFERLAGAAGLSRRTRINLDMLRALAWIRRGEFGPARALLELRSEEARVAGDALAEAAASLNLGTLHRRQGASAEALRSLERAAELYETAGVLSGVGQARALLGGALREAGELARAQPLLESSLWIRERLGDEGGSELVRGMLGLLLADRGHVRAAREELERSARALEAAGRSSDAALPRARAREQLLRLQPRAAAEPGRPSEALTEGDPRLLLARARGEAYAERMPAALQLAQRALDLAQRLQQAARAAEARDLLALLRLDAPVGDPVERTLLGALASDSWSAGELAAVGRAAESLEASGRDDRAARAWLALAARAPERGSAREALARAERLLERCAAGLAPEERARFERTLLGRIDPWPLDLRRARERAEDEDIDMDLLTILEINHRLVRQEALSDLLGTIVESALGVTGAERGFLVLAEKGELRIDTALDSRRGGIAEPELEFSRSVVHRALEARRPLRLSNVLDDPELGAAPSVAALELRSILCVPFVIEEDLAGAIYVDHRLRTGAFAERTERLLSLLADQAALAIRQVRRTERIRELNRELNREVARKESDLRTAQAVLRDAQLAVPPGGLVGSSPEMRAVHQLLERAAQARLPVLVTGESGTGKELAARALHALSPRRERAFVSENCAAFPASLIEAELFGSRRGAFTGAEEDRAGLFERADGGTIFLDEIGELPLELQAKLLRVLETGEVRRLGDSKVRAVDFRLVAATNRALEVEVREGRFRVDLYYRLDGLRIDLPPLSARVADIPALVEHFLRLEAARSARPSPRAIAPAVLTSLCRRAWPGNVRELANEVARLCALSPGDLDDPALVREPGALRAGTTLEPLGTLAELERRAIERTVEACGGDKSKAAEQLGISRAKVYQRWKEWYGATE